MDLNFKTPFSYSLWSPYETIKDVSELIGVNLSDDVARNLALDVEYRIHEILETAIKFMRHSKRKILTISDIDHAFKVLNIEPLYGYNDFQPLNFVEVLSGVDGQSLYYIDDAELDFEKLINQDLPKVPRQCTFSAHWLAIEGIQPILPQNPLPLEIKNLPVSVRGAISSYISDDVLNMCLNKPDYFDSKQKKLVKNLEVKPLVKHVLSKELILYFDKVVEILLSTDPESESLKYDPLSCLRNDSGLHQLVPYFIQFIADQITNNLKNTQILFTMIELMSAILDNKTLFLDPYVHAFMPCILTLLLSRKIGLNTNDLTTPESQKTFMIQLSIREKAVFLLDHIFKVYGSCYSTLKPRVTRTFLKALLDPMKSSGSHYGVLIGLRKMGNEIIKFVLIGNSKVWYKMIIEDQNKSEFEKKILLSTFLDVLRDLKVKKDNDIIEENTNNSISDSMKQMLENKFGSPITELILKEKDAYELVEGIFYGEVIDLD